MKAVIIVDINVDLAVTAFEGAGVPKSEIKKVSTVAEANQALEAGKYVVSDNQEIVSRADLIDVCIDATGGS